MPRNKTPRDLKFALNTIYEKTGQKGNAEWAFPNAPEKGIAIKQEGANDNKYVIFDLPCLRAIKSGMFFIGPGRYNAFIAIKYSILVGFSCFKYSRIPPDSN